VRIVVITFLFFSICRNNENLMALRQEIKLKT
jgi:hypothetical protein